MAGPLPTAFHPDLLLIRHKCTNDLVSFQSKAEEKQSDDVIVCCYASHVWWVWWWACVCRYQSFLEHFAAVSYGDDLFASYLLLPLQQRFPVKLRQQLWGNHAHVLSFINISVEEVGRCGLHVVE